MILKTFDSLNHVGGVMAATEVKDYLENGNIVNSVNLPCLSKDKTGGTRVCVIAKADADTDAIVKATGSDDFATATRGDFSYTIIDNATNTEVNVDGVIKVRSL